MGGSLIGTNFCINGGLKGWSDVSPVSECADELPLVGVALRWREASESPDPMKEVDTTQRDLRIGVPDLRMGVPSISGLSKSGAIVRADGV